MIDRIVLNNGQAILQIGKFLMMRQLPWHGLSIMQRSIMEVKRRYLLRDILLVDTCLT